MNEESDNQEPGAVAASLLIGGKLMSSGSATLKGPGGVFVPGDAEVLKEPIPEGVLALAGQGKISVTNIRQIEGIPEWEFDLRDEGPASESKG